MIFNHFFSSVYYFGTKQNRTDGTRRTKLTDDVAYRINVDDEWICYQNTRDGKVIYKMHNNGTEQQQFNSDSSDCIHIIGDWIYYKNIVDTNRLYRILKTEEQEKNSLVLFCI